MALYLLFYDITMIEGIIFDMDGVIVNTEGIHADCWVELFARYGLSLTREEFFDHWTRQGKDIRTLVAERGLPYDPEQLREEKRALYQQRIRTENILVDGADEAVERSAAQYPIALCTSSYRVDVDIIMELTGLARLFRTIVTCDDVTHEKPHPEGFLIAAQRLGVAPAGTVVLEDAQKGIEAAYRGGFVSIAIPTDYTRDNDFSKSTYRATTLQEAVELIERL